MVQRVTGPFEAQAQAPLVIVGAGACGLVAALAARAAGVSPLVLERDPVPSGSTALSSGLVPAPASRFQRAAGVTDDTPDLLAQDILAKNHHRSDPVLTALVAREIAPTIEWLADAHGLPFELVQGFLYPGHSRMRMHGMPSRSGRELVDRLARAAEDAGIDVVTEARVVELFADAADRVVGLEIERPDGSRERVACEALVLACNGYGGNPELVREHLPEMAGALYFGHVGNTGDALIWGGALGAATADLGAYQGHGSVAHPQNILITWALMMEGGIQVNSAGERFSNEHDGYSEQSVRVLAQPEGIAWNIYDERLHRLGLGFEDYRQAVEAGAIRMAPDIAALAGETHLPAGRLGETLAEVGRLAGEGGKDRFGRRFAPDKALQPPWYAVRVTGALFHTQGGLVIDPRTRVLRPDGTPLPNLFAGGGAARGVSGSDVSGYLSGNGLLTAIALGRLAGSNAAELAASG